jgi:capsular polysaccharide export protein
MIHGGLSAFRGKRVLLLQGPLGPFFRRLAADLTEAGAVVHKVNFNGGDWLFFPGPRAIAFRGRPEAWPAFFESLLDRLKIDIVLLFGDCRLYHREAHAIAMARGLDIGVFEEGYLRPDWITLELFGVNGHSQIPRDPDFYRGLPQLPASAPEQPVEHAFRITALWATLYYLSASLLKPLFPHYLHHRPLTLLEALPWIRAGWRKLYFAGREGHVLNQLVAEKSRQFFLVPLQVHNDSQVCVHSPYADVSEFIEEVVASFAAHAPAKMLLVIKHHPRDRGYHDYTRQVRKLRQQFGLGGRLLYVHDLHLPTLLAHASGAVVINSTVGLSALHHNVPTKTTGSAFYDMEGLTFQGSLDAFWTKSWATVPNRELFKRFRGFLQHCMLLNGSFYRRLPGSRLRSGIMWTGDSEWLPCETRFSAKDATRAGHAGGGEFSLDRDPGKPQRVEPAHTR